MERFVLLLQIQMDNCVLHVCRKFVENFFQVLSIFPKVFEGSVSPTLETICIRYPRWFSRASLLIRN